MNLQRFVEDVVCGLFDSREVGTTNKVQKIAA